MNVKIYHNPRCSKNRQTLTVLGKSTNFKISKSLKNLSFDELKEIVKN